MAFIRGKIITLLIYPGYNFKQRVLFASSKMWNALLVWPNFTHKWGQGFLCFTWRFEEQARKHQFRVIPFQIVWTVSNYNYLAAVMMCFMISWHLLNLLILVQVLQMLSVTCERFHTKNIGYSLLNVNRRLTSVFNCGDVDS